MKLFRKFSKNAVGLKRDVNSSTKLTINVNLLPYMK